MSTSNCTTDLLEDAATPSYSNELYLLVSVATVTLSFVLNLSQLLLICQHGLYRTRMHLIVANLCAVGLLASAAVLWHIRRILVTRDDPTHSSGGGWHEYRLCMLLPSGLHLLSIFTFAPLITLLVLQHHHVAKRFNLMKQSVAVVYLLVLLSWCQAAVISLVPLTTGWSRWEGVCAVPLTWSSSFALLVCVLYFLHYPIVVIVLADLCLNSAPNAVAPEKVLHEIKISPSYMPVPTVTSEPASSNQSKRHSRQIHPAPLSHPLIIPSVPSNVKLPPDSNRPSSDRPSRTIICVESMAKIRPFSDPSHRSNPPTILTSNHSQYSNTSTSAATSHASNTFASDCNGLSSTSHVSSSFVVLPSDRNSGSSSSASRSSDDLSSSVHTGSELLPTVQNKSKRIRRCNPWFWYTQKRGMCVMMLTYALCTMPFILYTAATAVYGNQGDLCGTLVANEKATMWTTWLLVVFAALRPLFHIIDEDDELSDVTFSFITSICCHPKFRN